MCANLSRCMNVLRPASALLLHAVCHRILPCMIKPHHVLCFRLLQDSQGSRSFARRSRHACLHHAPCHPPRRPSWGSCLHHCHPPGWGSCLHRREARRCLETLDRVLISHERLMATDMHVSHNMSATTCQPQNRAWPCHSIGKHKLHCRAMLIIVYANAYMNLDFASQT